MTSKTLAVSTLLALASLSACKNGDDNNLCKLNTVTNNSGSTAFNYNADGKISTVQKPGETAYFSYFADSIAVTTKDNTGATYGYTLISLNTDQKVTQAVFQSVTGNIGTTLKYYYDPKGKLKMSTRKFQTDPADTTFYTFNSSGNLEKAITRGDTTVYDYYTSMGYSEGDALKLQQIMDYNAIYIENKNLVKSIERRNGYLLDYAYEFDDKGQVTKRTLGSGSAASVVSFTYDCK